MIADCQKPTLMHGIRDAANGSMWIAAASIAIKLFLKARYDEPGQESGSNSGSAKQFMPGDECSLRAWLVPIANFQAVRRNAGKLFVFYGIACCADPHSGTIGRTGCALSRLRKMSGKRFSDMTDSISSKLLLGVQEQDQESWHRLVNLYAPLVYGWCRRWRVPADDAPDIVQEVFRSVAGAVARFQREGPDDTFRGWLWTISRNAVYRYGNRQQRQPQGGGGTDQLQRLQQIPDRYEDDASFADESVLLLHAVMETIRGDFEDHTWDVFWRSAVQGHNTADIAADHSMTQKAVRQARYRVLKRLREQCLETFDL